MPAFSRLVSFVLRIGEIASAAVVAGILGHYIHIYSEAGINAWPLARWIYSEVVAGLSLLLGVVWLIPFSSGFFAWPFDIFLSLAWFAAFGILVDAIRDMACGSIWNWGAITNGSICSRWKAVEAFSFISAILWLVSGFVGIYFTFRVRQTTTDRHGQPGYFRRRGIHHSQV